MLSWSKEISLVNPVVPSSYKLSFLGDRTRGPSVAVGPSKVPLEMKAADFITKCEYSEALHLAGIKVRKGLKGAKLRFVVDGMCVLEGTLNSFAKDRGPAEIPWKRLQEPCLFTAESVEEKPTGTPKLGFMLPHGSWIQIYLKVPKLSKAVRVEIEVLLGLYGKPGEPKICAIGGGKA
jgi:hypothetical protein